MKIKIVKALLFLIPTVFMFMTMVYAPTLADVTSPFYVLLVGTFLGFDLAAVIKKTKTLNGEEYSSVKLWRYIIVGVSITILLIKSLFAAHQMALTVASLSASVYILASIVIAGLDLNRAAVIDKGAKK